MTHSVAAAPLVVHIIHRLQVGGLENGLVNLINHMPVPRYRHAIVCMTESTDFRRRITRADVEVYELHKQPGHDLGLYLRLWRLLRKLRPAIVHTRNIGTLECQAIALLAGIGARVHGEHGRDMNDLEGRNATYLRLRKLFRPVITRYIAVSQDLKRWLRDDVRVPARKVVQIYNGVDAARFHPAGLAARAVLPPGFAPESALVVGTVGRMSAEKDQLTLLQAFLQARQSCGDLALRLVLVGDGPLKPQLEQCAYEAGAAELVWFAGARSDIPDLLRSLDIFVLPSLGEGISNTILESMACGLPVLATRVGGNPELVSDDVTGMLVTAARPDEMAQAIIRYANAPESRASQGLAARARIESEFSMRNMVEQYMGVYDAALS